MDDFRLHCSGIEPGNVEQCPEYFFNRVERGIDICDQLGVVAATLPLDQTGDVETGGIERLQDVVACRSEEASFGDVGLFGLAFGAAELGVEASQFFGAPLHPPAAPATHGRARVPPPPSRWE